MSMTNVPSMHAALTGSPSKQPFSVGLATPAEREEIYRIRHEVYARELGQHGECAARRLRDNLDDGNIYLVARTAGELSGFISVTPPELGRYSIDKYFERGALPFTVDDGLYEIRLLTVVKAHRGREMAMLLMYSAFRWVESRGGERIAAIGRREILNLYLRVGLKPAGQHTQSGRVIYDLLQASVEEIRSGVQQFAGVLSRLEGKTQWQFGFEFNKPPACFHGGAFFAAIGERFDTLERSEQIINADVLDAWFPPSPRVLQVLEERLSWLARTSPPTGCHGLIEAIATARGVKPRNILPGAGSSDLIFRALRQWLSAESHALILDPTYGEYAHVLEQVIGCTTDRLTLRREDNFEVDLDRLRNALGDGYDLVVIVNPNSPTGRHIPREMLEDLLRTAPARTRVWVDETYVEYARAGESLEKFAAQSDNVIVCKSMSKVYALSGMRVAYLCAGAHQLEDLRAITPPWVVGLPAQVAATIALGESDYYTARYAETHQLRAALASDLENLGWEIVPGIANFLFAQVPKNGPSAAEIVRECRKQGLFLRDAAMMGSALGDRAVRVAVKDAATNQKMVRIIKAICGV